LFQQEGAAQSEQGSRPELFLPPRQAGAAELAGRRVVAGQDFLAVAARQVEEGALPSGRPGMRLPASTWASSALAQRLPAVSVRNCLTRVSVRPSCCLRRTLYLYRTLPSRSWLTSRVAMTVTDVARSVTVSVTVSQKLAFEDLESGPLRETVSR
jgi:hypothetical protein